MADHAKQRLEANVSSMTLVMNSWDQTFKRQQHQQDDDDNRMSSRLARHVFGRFFALQPLALQVFPFGQEIVIDDPSSVHESADDGSISRMMTLIQDKVAHDPLFQNHSMLIWETLDFAITSLLDLEESSDYILELGQRHQRYFKITTTRVTNDDDDAENDPTRQQQMSLQAANGLLASMAGAMLSSIVQIIKEEDEKEWNENLEHAWFNVTWFLMDTMAGGLQQQQQGNGVLGVKQEDIEKEYNRLQKGVKAT